jgi:hypothetical protein
MRSLTLNEKISIKGKLARKGIILPKLTMEQAVFLWERCYGISIKYYYLLKDINTTRKPSRPRPSYVNRLQYAL